MNANLLPLSAVPPNELTRLSVYANPGDIRRDLSVYMHYVNTHAVKRTQREHSLPQGDYKRLAHLLKVNERPLPAGAEWRVLNAWGAREANSLVDYVDALALHLGLVSYPTESSYRGYYSSSPTFGDNAITVNAEVYRQFLTLPIADQERRLLEYLVENQRANEFFVQGVLGRLDCVPSRVSRTTGAIARVDFVAVRRFLLDLLQGLQVGVWYSTASLIAYLKTSQPFFMLPQKLPDAPPKPNLSQIGKIQRYRVYALQEGPPTRPPSRYDDFYETNAYPGTPLPDHAPDGFERFEGRYVERFLEGFPLTLGYVEVAYDAAAPTGAELSRGSLKAFRLTERFQMAMHGEIPQPRISVQPNFEIYIESAFYPAYAINRLTPLADLIREDTTTIFRLQKQKVAEQLVANDGLDIVHLLTVLNGKPLPQNVQVELQEWTHQADVFTLYDGFGLLEYEGPLDGVDAFTVEPISDSLQLVHSPDALFARLWETGTVTLRVAHSDSAFEPLPEPTQTIFPHKGTVTAPQGKPSAVIQIETQFVLHVSALDLYERLLEALLDLGAILDADKQKRTMTLSNQQKSLIQVAVEQLRAGYDIEFEELS